MRLRWKTFLIVEILVLLQVSKVLSNGWPFLTCGDVLLDYSHEIPDGEYTIYLPSSNVNRTVFCSFDFENGYAWTLVESLASSLARLNAYNHGFAIDSPFNEMFPIYKIQLYRLGHSAMADILEASTHVLALSFIWTVHENVRSLLNLTYNKNK